MNTAELTDVIWHMNLMVDDLEDEYEITARHRRSLEKYIRQHPKYTHWQQQCHRWEQGETQVASDDLLDAITEWLDEKLG